MTDTGRGMTSVLVSLARGLPGELAPELARRLFFIAPEITGFELVDDHGVVTAVRVTLAGPAEPAAVAAKINKVVTDEVMTQRPVPPRVLWRSPVTRHDYADAFPQALELGCAFVSGEGQVGLGEPLLSLMEYLDRQLRAIALGLQNAREYRYPTLLPVTALERIGYFGSFPQFAMFVTRLHNDIDTYREFIGKFKAGQALPDDLFEFCRSRDYCLPPTMCYHTYHQLQQRSLPENAVITARGKSFRYESRYHAGLERLWDFTIREIVFLGGQEFVTRCRDGVMRQAFELMERLELAGSCEVASDHFFADADTASRILSQRMMELKLELRLPVDPVRSIAAGSFNLHGQFFGESFGIGGPDGRPAASGCVGFGLERLVHAFACQHGLDPARWPAAVRQGIG